MKYLERFLAKRRGGDFSPAPESQTHETSAARGVILASAPDGNLRNLQNPVSEVMEVRFPDPSKNHKGDEAAIALPSIPSPVISATIHKTPATDLDRLVREYAKTFRRIDGLSGPELQAATDRLLTLARRINRHSPGFDWPALWRQEGAIPERDPAATWDEATLDRIEWLILLAATAQMAFRLPSGRWVNNPSAYLEALQRGVAQGPNHTHAGQVAADLLDLTIALKIGEGNPANYTPTLTSRLSAPAPNESA